MAAMTMTEPALATRHDPRVLTDYRQPVGFLAAPFARRTWREFGYLTAAMPLAIVAFTYAVFVVSFGASIAFTVVGLMAAGVLVVAGRYWGVAFRGLARSLLGVDVRSPAPFRKPKGFWPLFRATLGDPAGWRVLAFGVIAFPLSLMGWILSITLMVTGIGSITHGLWARFLPGQLGTDGRMHKGAQFGQGWFVDTPARFLLLAVVGVVIFWLWPVVNRAFASAFAWLTVALLGPTKASLRVSDLERSRGATVEDADARLRRIERDLHDGTQARLVAVAMQLGEAKEQLADGGDSDTLALVASAHTSTKEALVELRELARGIHPPALDDGLAVALETLAARTPMPVTVVVDDDAVMAPAVQTIAYYSVAELVTNAVKHARATGITVVVERDGATVRLRVRDDGRGGAVIAEPDALGHRSGLGGLVDRIRAVDGDLVLTSPTGGPTVVTVTLPAQN